MNMQKSKLKIILFTIATNKIKYLAIHLKLAQDLYADQHKILMKEIKDLNKRRDILCLQIGRFNIVKTSILPKLIYRLNAIPIKKTLRRVFHHRLVYSKIYTDG